MRLARYVPSPSPRQPLHPHVEAELRAIGQRVRWARTFRGWSQRKLGDLSGVPQSTISRLENGRLPGLALQRLARVQAALDGRFPTE